MKALDITIRLAKERDGRIGLIHVYSTPIQYSTHPDMPLEWVPGVFEETMRKGESILEEGEAKARAGGIPVQRLLRKGNVVKQIVKAAEEGKFDLIVMGARGISKVKEILLGSVSDGVVRKAPCPVLIIK